MQCLLYASLGFTDLIVVIIKGRALARWLIWLECCPLHQKVVGLIPCVCGCGWEAINQYCSLILVSLFLPPLPLSLKSINKR